MKKDIFQALADPTRRAIMSLILVQAMTPNALAEQFESSRQAVSKHIKVLHEAGLLKSKQVGREIYYEIEAKRFKELDKWLAPFRQLWEERFDRLDTYLAELQKEKRNGK